MVGMGRDFAEASPGAKAWFDQARTGLGYDLPAICFEGPETELTKTENAQPGIYLVSWVAFQLLKERLPNLQFEATAGLSSNQKNGRKGVGPLGFY